MGIKKDPGELIEEILLSPAQIENFVMIRDLLALPEERRLSLINILDNFLEGGEKHEEV